MSQKPHAYGDSAGTRPRGGGVHDSRLYGDNDGKISALFPTRLDNGANQFPVIQVGQTSIKIAGHTFVPFISTAAQNNALSAFFKFRENGQDKSDWIPVVRNQDSMDMFLQPVSPSGANFAVTQTNVNTYGQARNSLAFHINFDEVVFITAVAFAFNALIASGNAAISVG